MTSMVTEFDLVCQNDWIKAFLTSMVPAAVFFGALIGGPTSDYLGRKPTMGVGVLIASFSGLIAAFMDSWWSFLLCWIVIHVSLASGNYEHDIDSSFIQYFQGGVAAHVYSVEIIGPSIRQQGSAGRLFRRPGVPVFRPGTFEKFVQVIFSVKNMCPASRVPVPGQGQKFLFRCFGVPFPNF